MKRKIFAVLLILFFSNMISSFADTVSEFGTMDAGAESVFSIEFYQDANVLYGGQTIPFTDVDPNKTFVESDGRTLDGSKSDTGVVVRTNLNQPWDLKMQVTTSSSFDLQNFKFYMGRPWHRTLNQPADGTLGYPETWNIVPTTPTMVYLSGPNDMNNLVYGTLATMSFALFPAGMVAGNVYTMTITYTIALTA